jgi:hypothetical protein
MNVQQSSIPAGNQPLSAAEVASLLSTLCVRLGFCLPPAEAERLCQAAPSSIDAFTGAVLMTEGLSPDTTDRQLNRQVRALVAAAFQKHLDHEQFLPTDRNAQYGGDNGG